MMNRTSYAPVSVLDDPLDYSQEEHTVNRTNRSARLQDYHSQVELRCPPPTFRQNLPEAEHLTWTDPFYDGKIGVIAAFDRDGERAGTAFASRYLRHAGIMIAASAIYWILAAVDYKVSPEASVMDDIMGVYALVAAAFFVVLAWRAKQAMIAQHIAVTTEGIRVDNGSMLTITIPFEHIQKLEVRPLKGLFCCSAMDPTMMIVTVHRESTPLEKFCCHTTKKLELYGILHAQEFSDLVMGLKDAQRQGTYQGLNHPPPHDDTTHATPASRVELQVMTPRVATIESV
jgi:hypothetical protein